MSGLGVERYETKTRGTREKPAARIAGEGQSSSFCSRGRSLIGSCC